MGTNVSTHLCVQRPGPRTEHVSAGPFIGRNYELYSLMGLRGRGGPEPVFVARGMPEGADSVLQFYLGVSPSGDLDSDYSFRSWLTTEEARAVAAAYESLAPEEMHQAEIGFVATIGAMEAIDRWCESHGGGHALLVFAFG